MSEEQILEAVVDGTLFGMVEVDISIPDHWPEGNDYISKPHEYFQEMVPIFCTTYIPFSAVGDHMQDYVRRNGLSENPVGFSSE